MKATRLIRAKKISNWQRVRSIAFDATLIFKKPLADAVFLYHRNDAATCTPSAIVLQQNATTIQTFGVSNVDPRGHTTVLSRSHRRRDRVCIVTERLHRSDRCG